MKIFCPCCAYRPRDSDRWQCRPGCYTVWNTFETHARCPGCGKQWRETWCPSCDLVSPHDEWYHHGLPDEEAADIEQMVVVRECGTA